MEIGGVPAPQLTNKKTEKNNSERLNFNKISLKRFTKAHDKKDIQQPPIQRDRCDNRKTIE